MELDPKIWGPHYWFTLHTIAMSYPLNPNTVTKKKYYDFIQNLPLFIPIPKIGDNFSLILDKFPVTPYLDSRESFIRWMHFIHNKLNKQQGLKEITLRESINNYYKCYKPKEIIKRDQSQMRKKYIYASLLVGVLGLNYYLYKK